MARLELAPDLMDQYRNEIINSSLDELWDDFNHVRDISAVSRFMMVAGALGVSMGVSTYKLADLAPQGKWRTLGKVLGGAFVAASSVPVATGFAGERLSFQVLRANWNERSIKG